MTDPDRLAHIGEDFRHPKDVPVRPSCEDLMLLIVDLLDIQHHEVRVLHEFFPLFEPASFLRKGSAAGIERRMNSFFLSLSEKLREKINLHQRFSAADCDSAFIPPVIPVTESLLKKVVRTVKGSLFHFPGIGIMTELAAHGTAAQEDHITDSRAVHRAKAFQRMNIPHMVFHGSHLTFCRGRFWK